MGQNVMQGPDDPNTHPASQHDLRTKSKNTQVGKPWPAAKIVGTNPIEMQLGGTLGKEGTRYAKKLIMNALEGP